MGSILDSSEARQLRQSIDWHLENIADDTALSQRLEGMASSRLFGGMCWYWGPRLYARNRARFRPFIQQHLTEWVEVGEGLKARVETIDWKGQVADALDPWLADLDAANDSVLFRRLYAWKHRRKRGWGLDPAVWSADVANRFRMAPTASARSLVLEKFDQAGAALEEHDALAMYEAAAQEARAFVLRHLPQRGWRDDADKRWQRLADRARAAGDGQFALDLYRRQVPMAVWRQDVLELARTVQDAEALRRALAERHPDFWSDLGPVFIDLLEARGTDVIPYVQQHMQGVRARLFGGDSARRMARLAKSRGWVDFRIGVLVKCGQAADYNKGLAETLEDPALAEPERLRRLALFSGISREWNFLGWGLAAVHPLEPAIALQLYERHPSLVRTQFKAHVSPAAWGEAYLPLFERAWAAGDDDLSDHLASRYVTRGMWRADKGELAPAERVADLLVGLKLEPRAFAERAAAILTRVPAYAIHHYASLIRNNRLARLLYERSLKDYLDSPSAVRDLVEGSDIHVQRLAYRVLGQDDPRAWTLAVENLDALMGTLLRSLHRETRSHAFAALKSAARAPEAAARVLARAREAFALPDQHYPKEKLLDLVAAILARHPRLAHASEARVVYGRAA